MQSIQSSTKFNELEELIVKTYKDPIKNYLFEILSKQQQVDYYKDCQIRKSCLEMLNSIGQQQQNSSLPNLFIKGIVYDIIIKHNLIEISKVPSVIMINTVNIIYTLCDKLQGTFLAQKLQVHAKIILNMLSKRRDISQQEQQSLQSLLELELNKSRKIFNYFEENDAVKEINKLAKSVLLNDKVLAVQKLRDLMCECISLEEQLEVATKKLPSIIKLLLQDTNVESGQLFQLITRFLSSIIVEFEFLVRIPPSTKQSNPESKFLLYARFDQQYPSLFEIKDEIDEDEYNIQYYRSTQFESIAKNFDSLFNLADIIIQNNLQYPMNNELQIQSLIILRRIYYLLPKYRSHVEEYILQTFNYIDKYATDLQQRFSAPFLYKLLYRDKEDASSSFKDKLTTKGEFYSLYQCPTFKENVLFNHQNNIESRGLGSLLVECGFPHYQQIEPGVIQYITVEVMQPWSIISWRLQIEQYDIGFTLQRICKFKQIIETYEFDQEQVTTILKVERVQCNDMVYVGSFLAEEPGLYRIILNNTFSWFNSKKIRYSVNVLVHKEINYSLQQSPEPQYQQQQQQNVLTKSQILNTNSNESSVEKILEQSLVLSPKNKKEISNSNRTIFNIDENGAQFILQYGEKSYEIEFSFSTKDTIDWNKLNSKISDSFNKIFQNNNSNLTFLVIYDKEWLKSVLVLNHMAKEPQQYFYSKLPFFNDNKNVFKPLFISSVSLIENSIDKKYSNNNLQQTILLLLHVNFHKNIVYCTKIKKTHHTPFDIDFSYQLCSYELQQPRTFNYIFTNEPQIKKKINILSLLVANSLLQNEYISSDILLIVNEETSNVFFNSEDNQKLFRDYLFSNWNELTQQSLSSIYLNDFIKNKVNIIHEHIKIADLFY